MRGQGRPLALGLPLPWQVSDPFQPLFKPLLSILISLTRGWLGHVPLNGSFDGIRASGWGRLRSFKHHFSEPCLGGRTRCTQAGAQSLGLCQRVKPDTSTRQMIHVILVFKVLPGCFWSSYYCEGKLPKTKLPDSRHSLSASPLQSDWAASCNCCFHHC